MLCDHTDPAVRDNGYITAALVPTSWRRHHIVTHRHTLTSAPIPAPNRKGQARVMNSFDSAIVEFACEWLPYGTPPPEELLTQFGMTSTRYEQQLSRILDDYPSHIPLDTRRKLWLRLAERQAALTRATASPV